MSQKKYAAYIRVSSRKQGEEGVSLKAQKAAIESYAEQHALTITEWFEEQVTAAKQGRSVFGVMLNKLKRGTFQGIIIHKIDRSARNLKDWAEIGELKDNGIDVRFVHENLDFDSRGGRLAADIQAVVAADYIRNLSEETRKGFYGRLRQGLYPLPAPIGYLDQGKGKPKIPDPVKERLVKKLFELYATGHYSLYTLMEKAKKIGLRNRNGQFVSLTGISTILNNTFYCGIITIRKTGETYNGVHIPLISTALFKRVQGILHSKSNTSSITHNFLFRRLLRCMNCGRTLIGERQKGWVYYRCHTKGCVTKCVREEVVDETVLSYLHLLQASPEEEAYIEKRIERLRGDFQKSHESIINALQLREKHIEAQLHRLTDLYVSDDIDKDAYTEHRASLVSERQIVKEEILKKQDDPTSILDTVRKNLELANGALQSYQKGFTPEKRELLDIVTSNRYVLEKSISIEPALPFQLIANRPQVSNGGPYRDIPRTWDVIIEAMMNRDNKN